MLTIYIATGISLAVIAGVIGYYRLKNKTASLNDATKFVVQEALHSINNELAKVHAALKADIEAKKAAKQANAVTFTGNASATGSSGTSLSGNAVAFGSVPDRVFRDGSWSDLVANTVTTA